VDVFHGYFYAGRRPTPTLHTVLSQLEARGRNTRNDDNAGGLRHPPGMASAIY